MQHYIKKARYVGRYGGRIHSLQLDRSEWGDSRSDLLLPGEIDHSSQRVGGSVGRRASLRALKKRIISYSCLVSTLDFSVVQSAVE
jgi:hypothetical protein